MQEALDGIEAPEQEQLQRLLDQVRASLQSIDEADADRKQASNG
ncbi:hypothetical protein [Parasphingorhabdus halotolerans]